MRRATVFLFALAAGCSPELDREADHSNAIANSAADIADKADEQVNATIEHMGAVEAPVEGENAVGNEAGNGN